MSVLDVLAVPFRSPARPTPPPVEAAPPPAPAAAAARVEGPGPDAAPGWYSAPDGIGQQWWSGDAWLPDRLLP